MSPIAPLPTITETTPQMGTIPTVTTPLPITCFTPKMENRSFYQTWERPLNLLPPSSPIDSILVDLVQRQRDLFLGGSLREIVIGPYSPSLEALLNPARSNSVHPLISVMSSLLEKTSLRGFPEKVAALFLMNCLTQWRIMLSEETYNNLPEWFVPGVSQLLVPHRIWVDHVSTRNYQLIDYPI
jgi:hypothetical protein